MPGLETTSGPLGSGLSQASGIAYSFKMDKKKNLVFCLTGDGELDEGNHWEAVMFASKNKLNNLITIVDRNFIQIDGNTKDIMPLTSLKKKYEAFNWNTVVIDGNNMKIVLETLKKAKKNKNKPLAIIAKTVPGKGVSYMENDYTWHGKAPNENEAKIALKELSSEKRRLQRK